MMRLFVISHSAMSDYLENLEPSVFADKEKAVELMRSLKKIYDEDEEVGYTELDPLCQELRVIYRSIDKTEVYMLDCVELRENGLQTA